MSPRPRSPARLERIANAAEKLRLSEGERQELLFTAQTLILCGLPYKATDKRSITREAKTSKGRLRVTFQANLADVPLPYGKDRVLLTFLLTKARQTDSPTVTFDFAREYLDTWGEGVGGKSYAALADRWRRLSGLTIVIERDGADSPHHARIQTLVEELYLPPKAGIMAERAGRPFFPELEVKSHYQITFSASFWEDFKRFAVPLNASVMKAFATRPLAWDFVQFVHYRSFAVHKQAEVNPQAEARIGWNELLLMLGTSSRDRKGLLRELRAILEELAHLWPQHQARFEASTLHIAPPTDGIGLVATKAQDNHRTMLARVRKQMADKGLPWPKALTGKDKRFP